MWIPTIGCNSQVIKRTLRIVFGIHFALILTLCLHHFFWKEKPKTKIVVRTIPQKTIVTAEKPKQNAVKPKAVPAKPKPVPVKTPAPKPKEEAKAIVKTKQTSEPIVKTNELQQPVVKVKSVDLPVPVIKIKSDDLPAPKVEEKTEENYGQILIAYLQGCLDLPEFGEVKVDLEIDRNGHLVHFEILEEKSKKNAEFLKKRLPELVLPCFNGSMNETAIFTITFKNSIVR
ncbi:MAG TPA: hypothetical protein VLE96_00225 [Chlamydiales bacterium]|nr:hypothetical protein [Chlamydiales bacterium]